MTHWYDDASTNLGKAVKILQDKKLAGVEVEYLHTGGGIMCLHWHTPTACYYFGVADEQLGYQVNDPTDDCNFLQGGVGGYATDVASDGATGEEMADWVVAVATTGAPFEYGGALVTDPTWDETRRNRVDWRTYWGGL